MTATPAETLPMKVPTPSPAEAALLLKCASDRELLLAWKLGFHYCISAPEASRLNASDVLYEDHGLPHAFRIPTDDRIAAADGWYVPIKPQDRPLMKVLIPRSGRLFRSKAPFDRLIRLAQSMGIQLYRRSFRQAALMYALASGFYHDQAAELARLQQPLRPRFLFCPVAKAEAQTFCSLGIDPGEAAKLPRLRRMKAR
jgi:hypothetical protein